MIEIIKQGNIQSKKRGLNHTVFSVSIRHSRNDKGAGVSRNCFWDGYWDAPVSCWPIFSMSLVTVQEVFAKVNSFLKWRMAFIQGFMFPTGSPYSRPVLQIQVNSFGFLQVDYSVQVTYGRLPTLDLEDFRRYFALKFILYWIFSINAILH